MSRENVGLFIKAINTKPELNGKIARTTKASDWVSIGKTAGFEFTIGELVQIVSTMLNKPITEDNVIREYFTASNASLKGELSNKALSAAVGGMRAAYVKCNPLFSRG